MKQIQHIISRITLALMRKGCGGGLPKVFQVVLLVTLFSLPNGRAGVGLSHAETLPDVVVGTEAVSQLEENTTYVFQHKQTGQWLTVTDGKLVLTDTKPVSSTSTKYASQYFTPDANGQLAYTLTDVNDPSTGFPVDGGNGEAFFAKRRNAEGQSETPVVYLKDQKGRYVIWYNNGIYSVSTNTHAATQWHAYKVKPSNHSWPDGSNGYCVYCDEHQPATTVYKKGSTTEVDHYAISNAGQLYWFADKVNTNSLSNANAKLTKDITVNKGTFAADGTFTPLGETEGATPRAWTPIGNFTSPNYSSFKGTFDGDNHTVSGLYFNDKDAWRVGLIGLNQATIMNVGLVDSYIKGDCNVGGICGENSGTITNCYTIGTVTGSSSIGGVCGYHNTGTITNCYTIGTVTGSSSIGGVCGLNYATISNCYAKGTITGSQDIGGVCGKNQKTISNCYSTATVTCDNENVDSKGGICGYSEGDEEYPITITNCYSLIDPIGYSSYTTLTTAATKSAAEFKSGEVAWLLNGSVDAQGKWTEGPVDGTQTWYQNLATEGGNNYPVFAKAEDGSNTVYYGYENCQKMVYSNSAKPTDRYVTHIYAEGDDTRCYCTRCNHGFFRYASADNAVVNPYSGSLKDGDGASLTILMNKYYATESKSVMEFGKPLVQIVDNAFQNCTGLTGTLTIPNTVTTIGWSAFMGCTGLTGTLTIPNSVTTIGWSAFKGCTGLSGSLTIPNSVTTIGAGAFEGCESIKGTLSLPSTVNTIGMNAFKGCKGLTGTLTIPTSVTSIGNFAFNGCQNLTGTLDIPNTITSIGEGAFANCTKLEGVAFNSIPQFGQDAFYLVSSNKTLTLTDASYVYTGEDTYLPSFSAVPTYSRTMTTEWGTLVLPFTVDAQNVSGFKFYYVSSVTADGKIHLKKMTTDIAAGTPVFVRCLGEGSAFELEATDQVVNTTLTPDAGANTLSVCGVYNKVVLTNADTDAYFIYNDLLWNATQLTGGSKMTILPFHAYLTATTTNAAKLQIVAEEEATGINNEQLIINNEAGAVYNLQGQKLAAPRKGINIINGKKVLIK